MTFPLVVALEREPALRARLEALLAATDGPSLDELGAIAAAIRATGALAATRKLAEEHVQRALEALDELPAGAGARGARDRRARIAGEAVVTERAGRPDAAAARQRRRCSTASRARYDFVNRVLSLGLDQRWRRRDGRARSTLGERRACSTSRPAPATSRSRSRARVPGAARDRRSIRRARCSRSRRGKLARAGSRSASSSSRATRRRCRYASCEIDAATIAFGIRNVPDRGRARCASSRAWCGPAAASRCSSSASRSAALLGRRRAVPHAARRAAARRAAQRRARVPRTSRRRSRRSRRPTSSRSSCATSGLDVHRGHRR